MHTDGGRLRVEWLGREPSMSSAWAARVGPGWKGLTADASATTAYRAYAWYGVVRRNWQLRRVYATDTIAGCNFQPLRAKVPPRRSAVAPPSGLHPAAPPPPCFNAPAVLFLSGIAAAETFRHLHPDRRRRFDSGEACRCRGRRRHCGPRGANTDAAGSSWGVHGRGSDGSLCCSRGRLRALVGRSAGLVAAAIPASGCGGGRSGCLRRTRPKRATVARPPRPHDRRADGDATAGGGCRRCRSQHDDWWCAAAGCGGARRHASHACGRAFA